MGEHTNLSAYDMHDKIATSFGDEKYLKENFPLLHQAIQRSPVLGCEKDTLKESACGRKDITEVNILEERHKQLSSQNGKDNAQSLFTMQSHFSYIDEQSCVFVDTSLVDDAGKYFGGKSYVLQSVYNDTLVDPVKELIVGKQYELTAESTFSNFGLDEEGKPVLLEIKKERSINPYVTLEGAQVVASTNLIEPINKFPVESAQTYIVYGKREDTFVSHQYKEVPPPFIIDGNKYAEIWCPFIIEINLNTGTKEAPTNFRFFKEEPLSDVDFSVRLESKEPAKYGGGGVSFNANFKDIKKELSNNDTTLKIEIPIKWATFLTVTELNTVIGLFDFRAHFNVNYSVPVGSGSIQKMTPINAATDVSVSASSVRVEPLKIRWGCIGKNTLIHTPQGLKRAQDLKQGDCVIGVDCRPVEILNISTGQEDQIIEIMIKDNGRVLQVTDGHGVLTKRGIVSACEVTFEDLLMGEDGLYHPITHIEKKDYSDIVYDIETENHSLFLAGDVVIADNDPSLESIKKVNSAKPLPKAFIDELQRFAEMRNRGEK